MSAPEPTSPPLAPAVAVTSESPRRRYGDARYGMSLVAVLIGTYGLVTAPLSQLAQSLIQRQFDFLPLFLGEILLAAVVTLFGVLVAPTSGARRGASAAIMVLALLIVNITTPLYYSGALPIRAPGNFFLGAAFLYTLAGAAAWLTIRERNPIAYLFLLATIAIPLATFGVILANASAAVSTPVQNVLITVIGVGIAWAGWAVSRNRRPAHPQP